ncbi:MAG: heme exporter protein CcmB [Gammaproteobacteria bacterium RIFCSPHIGHO2_12_FULL_43_28]|nr:MAG: heme exporter protein CcmB [Gammaproteobacteria bacterium RIFCSPHIGHO2_12_FULL_43_28]
MLKTAGWLFNIELVLLWRRSQEWLYPLGFFVIVITLFPLAFTPDPAFLQRYVPGGVWIAALLASLLSVETIFYADLEDGNLEQLLLSPLPLPLVMLIKLGALWVATQLPLILLTPLIGLLFHFTPQTIITLCISLLLGTPMLTLIGSLCVALTLGLRQQGTLLGLLILPLVTPVLIFGVNMVQQSQAGFSIAGALSFLAGLTAFTITLLPFALAATLRISMDD